MPGKNSFTNSPSYSYGGPMDHEIAEYMRSIGHYELLTREEEAELLRQAKSEDKEMKAYAIDELVKHNQGLVIKIANKYKGKGVPLIDLVIEGNIGLMTAIEKFDISRNHKLSTYASWWIREKITRCISNESRLIRIPVYKCEKSTKIRSTYMEYVNSTGYEPTNEEIAEITGIKTEEVKELFALAVMDPTSLDATQAHDDTRTVADGLPGVEPDMIDDISHQMLIESVWDALEQLPEDQAFIIKNKYNLVENPVPKSEVQDILQITDKQYSALTRKAIEELGRMLCGDTRHLLYDVFGQ